MSLVIMINNIRRGKTAMMDLHEYVTAPSKTDNGTLIGAKSILTHLPITEMMTVKKLYFKTGGREQIHLVVSLTPDDRNRSDNVYMVLASKVASIFEGFQSYYAVHKDTEVRHLHIVLNSVSYIDGHKFSQSKSDLHRLKQQCNDLFEQFGFDPISIKPDDMLDSTDYSERTGFDFMEVYESVTNRNEISLSDAIEPYYGQIELSSEPVMRWPITNTISGGRNMNTWNTQQYPAQPETTFYPAEIASGQVSTFPDYPTVPSISLNTGTRYVVHMNESAPVSDIAAVVEHCGQVTEQQTLMAANVGWALHQKAQAEGQILNLVINPAPIVEIDLTGGLLPYNSEEIKPD